MEAPSASIRRASARFGFALLVWLGWQGLAVDCLAQEKGGQALSQEEADRAKALERQREMMESEQLREAAREAERRAREAEERARMEEKQHRERERVRERRPPDPVEPGPVTGTEGVVGPTPF